MKYTVSGSTLQYNVGLTLSFLSLISRGVGGIQKGNTSILLVPEKTIHCHWVIMDSIYKPAMESGGAAPNTTTAAVLCRIYSSALLGPSLVLVSWRFRKSRFGTCGNE